MTLSFLPAGEYSLEIFQDGVNADSMLRISNILKPALNQETR